MKEKRRPLGLTSCLACAPPLRNSLPMNMRMRRSFFLVFFHAPTDNVVFLLSDTHLQRPALPHCTARRAEMINALASYSGEPNITGKHLERDNLVLPSTGTPIIMELANNKSVLSLTRSTYWLLVCLFKLTVCNTWSVHSNLALQPARLLYTHFSKTAKCRPYETHKSRSSRCVSGYSLDTII